MRTKPKMEQTLPQPRKNERWGPEIYVHLEFRVSWGKKEQPPKSHQVTYRSRGPRERSPAFPRQVPATNTNYLAAIHDFDQRQSRLREYRRQFFNNPSRHHQMQEYYPAHQQAQPQAQPGHLQVPIIREPERPTRADARTSHERGRSAPPPIGENPWDVSVPQEANRATMEIRRKPLPAPPSQFRLGDGGQPWSTWSLPVGYDPDTFPRDEEEEGLPVRSNPADRNSTMYATNPDMVSTFSPGPAPVARTRDAETGRARELGALSAAMMTVDNGFENQWWYQGRRNTMLSDEPGTAVESPIQRWSTDQMTATTSPPMTPTAQTIPAACVVSPLTEYATLQGSPGQVPASLLQRTMSTRSEELWFHERSS
jgi:hypothetical protein